MQTFASVISFIVSIFSLLIIIRIFLSWMSLGQQQSNELYITICRFTDPLLNVFRSIPGLQRGAIDFAPLAALVTLNIINSIFTTMARQGEISLGIVLGIIVQALWSILSFFLMLFIILLIIRLVMDYTGSARTSQFAAILDSLVKWPVDIAHSLFFRGRLVSIRQGLLAGLLLAIGIRFLGSILMNWLIRMLFTLPI